MICACARSRSYCELRGCRAKGAGVYDGREPWKPRYYARQIDDDLMVIIDDVRKCIVSPPSFPEQVVQTVFEWNRKSGGFRFIHRWASYEDWALYLKQTSRPKAARQF
jgi:hypothetical protein